MLQLSGDHFHVIYCLRVFNKSLTLTERWYSVFIYKKKTVRCLTIARFRGQFLAISLYVDVGKKSLQLFPMDGCLYDNCSLSIMFLVEMCWAHGGNTS